MLQRAIDSFFAWVSAFLTHELLFLMWYNVVSSVNLTDFPSFPRPLDGTPLINDDLPGQILQGAIVLKPNLKGFKDSGVLFEDGTVEEDIDVVVFGTGYIKDHVPFLPTTLFHGPHRELMLYK